jgi:hypothetical protein
VTAISNQNVRDRTWLLVAALAGAGFLSRLPQLLSHNLLLEGDECILGLMGMHVAAGREFPWFFYGQKYGLAIVEAPAAALAFVLFGASAITLKIAMLAVWLAGIGAYFLAFSRVLGSNRSFCISLILLLMPAWGAASMKAWSGYITAFTLTGVVLCLMTRTERHRPASWAVAGMISVAIYFAHPLWMPGLMPMVCWFLIRSRRRAAWIAYAAAALTAVAFMVLLERYWLAGMAETWTRPAAGNPHLLQSLPRLLSQVYVNFTGAYYFGTPLRTGPVTSIVAATWLAVFALLCAMQIYRLVTRQFLAWSHLLFLSVLATLAANWVLLDWRDARYVLAMNAPLAFLAGVEFFDLADRHRLSFRSGVAALVVVLALQAVALVEFARLTDMWWNNPPGTPSEARTLARVLGGLRARGVTRVYTMNALLQWQVTFYSHEGVIARWKSRRDRYPRYITIVDRALNRGELVALVGYAGYTYGFERVVPDPQSIEVIDGKYFVYVGVNAEQLRRAGFSVGN